MADHAADRTPNRVITDPLVRRYLYGVVLAFIPILVSAGVLTGGDAQLWLNVAAAVLGLGTTGLAVANTPKN